MDKGFLGKLLDVIIDKRNLWIVLALAISGFAVYYLDIFPKYNSYIVSCSIFLSVLFVIQLLCKMFNSISLCKQMKKIINDPDYYKILHELYDRHGQSKDYDNRNENIAFLQEVGMIEMTSYLPVEFHDNFDLIQHSYSSYAISYYGKKCFQKVARNDVL